MIYNAGDKISDYEVLECLGSGGFAHVYKAKNSKGKIVAIKVLYFSDELDDDDRKQDETRFRREAGLLLPLDHPNIVKVEAFNVEGAGDDPFLVMEYIDGVEILKWVKNNKPSIKEIVDLFSNLLDALSYAHGMNVFHRDLNPRNILVRDNEPVIIDFGLAKLKKFYSVTRHSQLVGNYSIIAPEYYKAIQKNPPEKFDYNAQADLFGIGCLLYHVLTLKAPFKGDHEFVIINAVMNTNPEIPKKLNKDISEELSDFCMNLMEKEPSKRPQNAKEACAKLKKINLDPSKIKPAKVNKDSVKIPAALLDHDDEPKLEKNKDKAVNNKTEGTSDKADDKTDLEKDKKLSAKPEVKPPDEAFEPPPSMTIPDALKSTNKSVDINLPNDLKTDFIAPEDSRQTKGVNDKSGINKDELLNEIRRTVNQSHKEKKGSNLIFKYILIAVIVLSVIIITALSIQLSKKKPEVKVSPHEIKIETTEIKPSSNSREHDLAVLKGKVKVTEAKKKKDFFIEGNPSNNDVKSIAAAPTSSKKPDKKVSSGKTSSKRRTGKIANNRNSNNKKVKPKKEEVEDEYDPFVRIYDDKSKKTEDSSQNKRTAFSKKLGVPKAARINVILTSPIDSEFTDGYVEASVLNAYKKGGNVLIPVKSKFIGTFRVSKGRIKCNINTLMIGEIEYQIQGLCYDKDKKPGITGNVSFSGNNSKSKDSNVSKKILENSIKDLINKDDPIDEFKKQLGREGTRRVFSKDKNTDSTSKRVTVDVGKEFQVFIERGF